MLDGMTNIKASEVLKEIKYYTEDLPPYSPDEVAEALEMAIKALEAQPSEDCISRQAVIILIDEASEMHPYKVVGDSDTYSNYNQGWSDACDWLYANIEGVPSVTPERPKGKWTYIGNSKVNGLKICKCSVCEKRTYGSLKYCPNCGAEMSGGSEDADSN